MKDKKAALNVLGQPLQACCMDPVTGYYRDGFCHTGNTDIGSHVICAEISEDFLQFTLARGNDLITPRPDYNFPGLVPGDRWCICAHRWQEAVIAGAGPKVFIEACHQRALQLVSLDLLLQFQHIEK